MLYRFKVYWSRNTRDSTYDTYYHPLGKEINIGWFIAHIRNNNFLLYKNKYECGYGKDTWKYI